MEAAASISEQDLLGVLARVSRSLAVQACWARMEADRCGPGREACRACDLFAAMTQ